MSSFASSRQLNLESSFDRRGDTGLEFLFERLAKESDQNLKISTIYLRHKSFLSASIGFTRRVILRPPYPTYSLSYADKIHTSTKAHYSLGLGGQIKGNMYPD